MSSSGDELVLLALHQLLRELFPCVFQFSALLIVSVSRLCERDAEDVHVEVVGEFVRIRGSMSGVIESIGLADPGCFELVVEGVRRLVR